MTSSHSQKINHFTDNLTVFGCDGSFSPITHKPVILTAPLNGILNSNSGSSSLSTTCFFFREINNESILR